MVCRAKKASYSALYTKTLQLYFYTDTTDIFTNDAKAGDNLEEKLFRFDICSFIKKFGKNAKLNKHMQFEGNISL